MKVRVWGARGSVPSPGPRDEPLRRQHVVACSSLLDSGEQLMLDAGTGIRTLGLDLTGLAPRSTSCSPTCTWTTSRG